MPGPALTKLALNSEYDDLHDLVYHIAGKFSRKYAIPVSDLIGPAHAVYVRERERWHKGAKKAALSSWLYTKIWYGLMSFVRREIIYRTRMGESTEPHVESVDSLWVDLEGEEYQSPLHSDLISYTYNYRLELEGELSQQAATVVSLVLDVHSDFAMVYSWHTHNRKKVEPHHMLNALREHLGDCGWPMATIEAAFSEIRKMLFPRADGNQLAQLREEG